MPSIAIFYSHFRLDKRVQASTLPAHVPPSTPQLFAVLQFPHFRDTEAVRPCHIHDKPPCRHRNLCCNLVGNSAVRDGFLGGRIWLVRFHVFYRKEKRDWTGGMSKGDRVVKELQKVKTSQKWKVGTWNSTCVPAA